MRHRLLLFLIAFALVPLTLFGFGASCSPRPHPESETRAAIIDQLYNLHPNEAFISEVTQCLIDFGFDTIEVYRGDELGLHFFIHLPEKGYKLIILREHSGILNGEDGENIEGSWLFTNEPCRQNIRYTDQRLTRKVAKSRVNENQPWIFAIGSRFVTESMNGQFNKTVVIAMGCHSLVRDDLAQAFIDKGASAYIGWSDLVRPNYTDKATGILVRNLCRKGTTIQEAIDKTIAEVGTEPLLETELRYYPKQSGTREIAELFR
ncbi:hypothetical protein ACFLWG_02895 [Chloroflexota bacterium]